MYIDNTTAIKRLNKDTKVLNSKKKIYLRPEYQVEEQIHNMMDLIRININPIWTPSHTNIISTATFLNSHADNLACQAHDISVPTKLTYAYSIQTPTIYLNYKVISAHVYATITTYIATQTIQQHHITKGLTNL